METLKIIGLALAICFLLLTPSVFAQLAIDDHEAKVIDVDISASVSIDSLSYNPGNGVVDLDGSFSIYNSDTKRSVTYDGDLRLKITAPDGTTCIPDSKALVSGRLEKNKGDNWWEVSVSTSKNTNLHVDCLSPNIDVGETCTMSANIALRVTGFRNSEPGIPPTQLLLNTGQKLLLSNSKVSGRQRMAKPFLTIVQSTRVIMTLIKMSGRPGSH